MKRIISIIFFVFLIGNSDANIKPRILGGEDAEIQNFPYTASLRYRKEHICGGVIISESHILTAAHCLTFKRLKKVCVPPYKDLTVVTGSSSSGKIGGNVYSFADITIHPGWTETLSLNNDIAVVKLAEKITFNEQQNKIEMANREFETGTTAVFTGWGTVSTTISKPSEHLQKIEMTLLSNIRCQLKNVVLIFNTQLCAFHSNNHGCSTGDSGGPLVVDNQLIGILSWVVDEEDSPDIFTKVYAHQEFIESAMAT